MRDAFSLFELLIALIILSLALSLSISFKMRPPLYTIAQSLRSHIQFAQFLALRDSRFFSHLEDTALTQSLSPSINPQKLIAQPYFWQIQFHLGGIYTQNSYSIYIDTPRFSPTTDSDNRPMSGDFIALEPFSNQCLSGYNNTNIADYCKNNASLSVRLKEAYGVSEITLEGDLFCKEKDGGRIYFDDFGVPHCGKTPQKLTRIFKITLKRDQKRVSLCITPITGYVFFCDS